MSEWPSYDGLRRLFADSAEGVALVDREFEVRWANRALRGRYRGVLLPGLPLCGHPYRSCAAPCPACPLREALATRRAVKTRLGASASAGAGIVDLAAFPLFDGEGEVLGLLVELSDGEESARREARESARLAFAEEQLSHRTRELGEVRRARRRESRRLEELRGELEARERFAAALSHVSRILVSEHVEREAARHAVLERLLEASRASRLTLFRLAEPGRRPRLEFVHQVRGLCLPDAAYASMPIELPGATGARWLGELLTGRALSLHPSSGEDDDVDAPVRREFLRALEAEAALLVPLPAARALPDLLILSEERRSGPFDEGLVELLRTGARLLGVLETRAASARPAADLAPIG